MKVNSGIEPEFKELQSFELTTTLIYRSNSYVTTIYKEVLRINKKGLLQI